jgi:hypothetical protein
MLSRVSATPSRTGSTVTFCSRATVRHLNYWSPETYRAGRKRPWLQLAADRLKLASKIRAFPGQ